MPGGILADWTDRSCSGALRAVGQFRDDGEDRAVLVGGAQRAVNVTRFSGGGPRLEEAEEVLGAGSRKATAEADHVVPLGEPEGGTSLIGQIGLGWLGVRFKVRRVPQASEQGLCGGVPWIAICEVLARQVIDIRTLRTGPVRPGGTGSGVAAREEVVLVRGGDSQILG